MSEEERGEMGRLSYAPKAGEEKKRVKRDRGGIRRWGRRGRGVKRDVRAELECQKRKGL